MRVDCGSVGGAVVGLVLVHTVVRARVAYALYACKMRSTRVKCALPPLSLSLSLVIAHTVVRARVAYARKAC
jgi:hypothetical protein